MYSADNKVIYVGKAKSIRSRLHSYFSAHAIHPKTEALVHHISKIDYVLMPKELDALILEQDLIKQHRPKYNILLKDDKSYPYVMLTDDDYPRLTLIRGSIVRYVHRYPNATFLGPFPESHAAKETLEWIQRTLMLRSCKDYEFKHRSRPCLQYQIGRCTAPCVGYVSRDEYYDNAQLAKKFLLNNHGPLKEDLQMKMTEASKRHDYEKAILFRDMLDFVQSASSTDFIRKKSLSVDIWGAIQWQDKYLVGLLNIADGVVSSVRFFDPFSLIHSEAWDSVLSAYYHCVSASYLPDVIRLTGVMHSELFEQWYFDVHKKSMGRINKKHLKDWTAVLYNNLEEKKQILNREIGVLPNDDYMQFLLHFKFEKPWIVAMDISHTSGSNTIGAMASFVDGKKDKLISKTYPLKPLNPGDDLESMRLLAKKLVAFCKKKKIYPDAYVIDGSILQLESVRSTLLHYGIQKPMFAVTKGPKRVWGEERIYYVDHEADKAVFCDYPVPVFHTLLRIRDYSHDLANKAHARLRTKAQLTS